MSVPGDFPEDPERHLGHFPPYLEVAYFDVDEDLPKRAALKEEYVSPEWKAWREGKFEGSRPPPPVDIIAVQGLASTYERTWTKKLEDGTGVMWLRDLLKEDIPLARILTFEYNSTWLENPANVSLKHCAQELLRAIIWDRSHRGENGMCMTMSRRPIIFIGHSYGGLVIKQAMVTAVTCDPDRPWHDDFQSIITSVSGIVYLGTPHRGSMLARIGILQTLIWNSFGRQANPRLLKPLEVGPGFGELDELHQSFLDIRTKDRMTGLKVFHFFETLPCKIGNWSISEVVNEYSACYGAWPAECQPLDSDHKNLNKYASREESNYKKVMSCLLFIHEASAVVVGQRWGRYQYAGKFSGDKLEQLQKWLNPFEAAFAREEILQSQRFDGTCEWSTRLDMVSRWLDPDIAKPIAGAIQDGRCLWVQGKAGSGKSVLSAFLNDQVNAIVAEHNKQAIGNVRCSGEGDSEPCAPASRADLWTALYFPFHNGAKFAQAIVTMVHRLLQRHPENKALHQVTDEFQSRALTPETAMNLLLALVTKLKLTYIIIDGLDECASSEVGLNQYSETDAMMKHLGRLCGIQNVRLLLFSRKEPVIEKFMVESLCSGGSILDMASHNGSDINLFIDFHISSFAEATPLPDDLQERIRAKIVNQSRGMFQWVKLVVEQLKFKVKDGNEEKIMEVLEQFPQELNKAYQTTIDRLSLTPAYNKKQAIVALKWLACARRPLTLHELSLVIRLHEKLESPAKPETEIIERILDKVTREEEEVLESEFSLLLGGLVEFQWRSNIVNVVDSWGNYRGARKTINICHHSLTQFLVSEPGEFRFPSQSAHSLIAGTCMNVMCARNAIETFLAHYYVKDREDEIRLFLDYAVENWSHHLRASGIRYEDELFKNDLTDLTTHITDQSLHLSLVIIGALSEACKRLNTARVNQMMQAIAIRDCQASILPTVNAVIKLRPYLPGIALGLRDINKELKSKGRLKVGTRIDGTTEDNAKVSLSHDLDSPFAVKVLALVDSDPDLFPQPLKSHLSHLLQTSRQLRALTIKLSVDPIRTWLDHQIGGDDENNQRRALNPIPALALTTHTLDVLLAAALLPTTHHDRSDFREQFFADTEHPMYGFIVSTRYCLDGRFKDVLTPTDYKDHVIGHYLLRIPEWWAMNLTTLVLQSNSQDNRFVNVWIRNWHTSSLMIQYESEDPNQASYLFRETAARVVSSNKHVMATADVLWFCICIPIVLVAKILAIMFPKIEQVLLQVLYQLRVKTVTMKPWFVALVLGWRHSSLALPLFLLRLKTFPWLLASPRNAPLKDLRGIYNDPFGYKTSLQRTSWKLFILLMIQEIIAAGLISYDTFKILEAQEEAQREATRNRHARLTRGVAGPERVDPGDVVINLPKPEQILMALARMIFIERTIFEISYIIFDILQISVQMLTPSSWSWSLFFRVSFGVFGHVMGAMIIHILGPLGPLIILFSFWFGSKVWRWLHLGSAVRFIFWATIATPVLWIWPLIKFLFVAPYVGYKFLTSNVVAPAVGFIAATAAKVAETLGPRGTVFLVAALLVLFFTAFIVIMTDPLQLRHAAFSCAKAGKAAARVTGVRDPLKHLNWKAGDGKFIEYYPLVDLDQLDELGTSDPDALRTSDTPPTTTASEPQPQPPPSTTTQVTASTAQGGAQGTRSAAAAIAQPTQSSHPLPPSVKPDTELSPEELFKQFFGGSTSSTFSPPVQPTFPPRPSLPPPPPPPSRKVVMMGKKDEEGRGTGSGIREEGWVGKGETGERRRRLVRGWD